MQVRHRNERGFILATALLAMVVVGAAVVAGYFVANQEYHVGKAVRASMPVFYAAQAGLERELATWSTDPQKTRERFKMPAGQPDAIGQPATFPNGASYSGTVTRIDNTPQSQPDVERYYLVSITARDSSPLPGEEVRNRQAMIVRVRYFDFCCSAALTTTDTLVHTGSAEIAGINTTPAWGTECDSASTDNKAGVQVADSGAYDGSAGSPILSGSPTFEEDTTLDPATIPSGEEGTWDLLRAKATHTYPPGDLRNQIEPNVNNLSIPASCVTADDNNWGEPNADPLGIYFACFHHFPILHAEGDFTVEGEGRGQGILVVDGNLTIKGKFAFYGIVLVEGSLLMEGAGPPTVTGSVVVRGEGADQTRIAGSAAINYSACAVQRAKERANLSRVERLALRSWAEALN